MLATVQTSSQKCHYNLQCSVMLNDGGCAVDNLGRCEGPKARFGWTWVTDSQSSVQF